MQGYSISSQDGVDRLRETFRQCRHEFLATDGAAQNLADTDTANGGNRIAVEVSRGTRGLEQDRSVLEQRSRAPGLRAADQLSPPRVEQLVRRRSGETVRNCGAVTGVATEVRGHRARRRVNAKYLEA